MRLRKYFKTVLSAMLAAAMVVTSVPANTAYAATIQTTEGEKESTIVTDGASQGNELAEEQTTEATEMETATTETESQTEEKETAEPSDTQESTAPANDAEVNVDDGGYWGPTIDYDANSDTAGAITVYYYAQNYKDSNGEIIEEVSSVQVKGAWNQSNWTDYITLDKVDGEEGMFSYTFPLEKWSTDESCEYGFLPNSNSNNWDVDDCNPNSSGNSTVFRNPVYDTSGDVILYYYPAHGAYPSSVKVKYWAEGDSENYKELDMSLDATHTKIYSATLSGLALGNYEYVFVVDEKEVTDTNNKETGKFSTVSYPEEDPNVKSPEVDGKTVKFHYYGPTAKEVKLMGGLTDWTEGKKMEYDADKGYWNLEMSVSAGSYNYKFLVDSAWKQDPLNDPDNDNDPNGQNDSILIVPGLVDSKVEITRDGSVTPLPSTLELYAEDGTKSDVAVKYSLSTETSVAEYKDEIVLGTDTETATVSIKDSFPEDVTSFTLTATDENSNTSTVTVNVVDAKYTYTIYYYDEKHNTTDTTALWIWETDGAGATDPTYFTKTEVLEDGKTWLKADVELSYTNVSIIPRAHDDWTWQDATRTYSNKEKAENTTLYIVYADGAKIYTELPEIKAVEERYLVVEYTRNDGSAKDWYFYTWNSGYGNSVFVPFEEVNGTWTAVVPVKQGVESISYCMERATTAEDGTVSHWAEKDGNDYLCPVPADQTVVKICMEEGKGITKTYPYNTGYEIVPKENKITFYYRNDEAFAAGKADKYASVQVEINGTAYDMKYNAEEQRYAYDMEKLEPASYKYRYILKETADSAPEYVIDKFNTEKVTENDNEYSVCKYELYNVEVKAQFANASMDYNDNNVLSFTFEGKDGAKIEGMEAVSATADLTALGGGVTEIDTKLSALSVAVKEGTTTGEKTIPVAVFDQYNNEYATSAKVTVTERNKGTDFDWDEAVIYFAVTDRFFDGDSSNNGTAANGYLVGENDNLSFHGGDFAGLTQKLDYLQDLGVNTIWITPIVENAMDAGLTTKDNNKVTDILSWGYHGYWASNFEKLDSHLGTEEQFKALLDAAHARGMKIMVDVVLNHSGYNNEDYFNNILKDEEDNSIPIIRTDEQVVSGSDQQYSLSGLPDFLTENAEVRDLLVEWQSNWVSKYDIDYYRVDTVKHVDDTTWSAFKNALTLIDPDFKMIGEWAGAGYATDTGMLRTGRMDSLLDFDFNEQALSFVTGSISATESFLTARNGAIDNTATLGAFLGSHDEDGFIYRLENEKGVVADRTEALAKVAASLQITTKGQVVIYYGEEIGMTGANNYPYQENRYDFDWSAVNDDNDMLEHYKKLLSIRKSYSEVFAKGSRTTICADDTNGLDVFAREYNGTTVYTALNIGNEGTTYALTGVPANSYLTDLYGNKVFHADEDGMVEIFVPAAAEGGTAIFVVSEGTEEETLRVPSIGTKVYTGKAITLSEKELEVYYGSHKLQKGVDYTVSYKNNKAVGTASVTVKAKGNYQGKETVNFEIVPKNVSDADIVIDYSADLIENGKNQKPLNKITYNGSKLKASDYKVEYFAVDAEGKVSETATQVKAVGTYKMVITGKYDEQTKKGSFTGKVEKEITVYSKDLFTSLKDMKITVEGSTKTYSTACTGSAIEPKVTVTPKKSSTPLEAECYTVTYKDNVNVGTATITITGVKEKGYIGTVTKTFKITGTPLKNAAEIDITNWKTEVAYDAKIGGAVQPVDEKGNNLVTLKAKAGTEAMFTENVDYTVSYQKNNKPGTATMVFTGIGKYTGTMKKTFKVAKVTLAADDTKLEYTVAPTAAYAKKGAKAAVTVKYDGVNLVEGKDYKLTYKNNKVLTTENMEDSKKPQVTITGIGAFTGKILNTDSKDEVKDTTFTIVKADLSSMNMTAAEVVYKNKKGAFMAKPVLTDASGAKLSLNKDYTVKYYLVTADGDVEKTKDDIVELDKETGYAAIKVVATAVKDSNYVEESTQTTTYRVVQASIAKASVKINAQVYTGKEITLSKEDFAKMRVGKDDLTLGETFEIVEGSYRNNINKGTASVTIKGIGNYGGTKKVTFKITSRTMAWWWNLLP